MGLRRGNKYRAIKTTIDGIVFDSKKEAARYRELKLEERAGLVKDIKVHERFKLKIGDVDLGAYEADFVYKRKLKGYSYDVWDEVVEDCKGFRTTVYKLKKKLMLAIYGISIAET